MHHPIPNHATDLRVRPVVQPQQGSGDLRSCVPSGSAMHRIAGGKVSELGVSITLFLAQLLH